MDPESISFMGPGKTSHDAIAVFGLAICMIGSEATRYPAVATAGSASLTDLGTLLTVLGLAVFALIVSAKKEKPVLGYRVLATLAILVSLLMFADSFLHIVFSELSFPGSLVFVLLISHRLCGFLLFTFWGTMLYWSQGRRSASFLAVAFLVAGIIQASIGILQPSAATIICSIAPVLSAGLFSMYVLLIKRGEIDAYTDSVAGEPAKTEATAADGLEREAVSSGGYAIVSKREVISALICFFLYGMLTFALHNNWLPAQTDEASAMAIQLFSAAGTIGAAIAVIALWRAPTRNTIIPLFKMLIFVVLIAATLVVVFSRSYSRASLFTSLLDASHKLVLFAAWIAPFYMGKPSRHPSILATLLATYQFGAFISAITMQIGMGDLFVFLLCPLTLCIEFTVYMIMMFLHNQQIDGTDPETRTEAGTDDYPEQGFSSDQPEVYEQIMFMAYLSKKYQLTKREGEIVQLLVRGMSVKDISDLLVISPETAKTHRRNIFQKMHVSSQQKLMERLEQDRNEDYSAFKQDMSLQDSLSV